MSATSTTRWPQTEKIMNYSIDDGHWNNHSAGHQAFDRALIAAAELAHRTGLAALVYESPGEGEWVVDPPAALYRAYDTVTEWMGPVRLDEAKAQDDADRHNEGCVRQGGYGSAIVVVKTDAGRCADLYSEAVWPPHGRTSGAVRWR